MKEIPFAAIEKKWQDYWKANHTYKTIEDPSKPKYYALVMFPYPSGKGLHVGHPLSYVAADIMARYKTHKGYSVLHPMGFDAFGLPAEQYAVQTGQHPAKTTEQNIATYKKQLEILGLSYDWDREVHTCDPDYYKWTQWIFLQLFGSWFNPENQKAESIETLIKRFAENGSKGLDVDKPFTAEVWQNMPEADKESILQQFRLAYLAESEVNWCEALGTVLANDEVINGVSERGGHPVSKKKMRQWFLRITAYAERLLQGLGTIDFPDALKEMQRNWIGKSEGASIHFQVDGEGIAPIPSPSPTGEGDIEFPKFRTADIEKYQRFLKERSRELRKEQTPSEEKLWDALRGQKLGCKFRRQHVIGSFIADFVCLEKNLVIEVDGDIHNEQKEFDEWRDQELQKLGFATIRFTNQQVLDDFDETLNHISKKLESGSTLPRGEGPGMGQPNPTPEIEVFTTRPDTIFGCTFMVVAPESDLTAQLTTDEQRQEVENYVEYVKSRSERDRMADVKKVTGAFTGSYAIHPFTKKHIPIWTSEYVLASYGTGAIMAVPAHDSRDYAFAEKFNLPKVQVVSGDDISESSYDAKEGELMNSDFLDGLQVPEAIQKALEHIENNGLGKRKVNYRLRDAGFSRQRYWGEPFPIEYQEGVPKPLHESDLPLTLPEVESYKPTGHGESPLAAVKDWANPASGVKRETDTMPGYAGSSWYFLRYMDPQNREAFVGKKAEQYWQDVDLYIGGAEHAVGHLLYSRLWQKVLFDLGHVSKDEPYRKMVNQGMIQGLSKLVNRGVDRENNRITYVSSGLKSQHDITDRIHVDVNLVNANDELDIETFKAQRQDDHEVDFVLEDGKLKCESEVEKMSKRWLNVVNPEDMVKQYGSDTFRMYEMFLGPITDSKPWNTHGIDGVFKFLRKFYNLFYNKQDAFDVSTETPSKAELKVLHACIQKVENDIEKLSFNTCVSHFMICVNELQALQCNKRDILEPLTILISPFAPHLAEALWEQLGHEPSITKVPYPKCELKYLHESEHTYPVMVNGKMRAKITLPVEAKQEDATNAALELPEIQKWTEGKTVRKVVFVPKKILNIVVG